MYQLYVYAALISTLVDTAKPRYATSEARKKTIRLLSSSEETAMIKLASQYAVSYRERVCQQINKHTL